MNLLTLLLQAFFDHQARSQADRLREAGLRAAEKGRRVALAAVFLSLAAAFFFSGLLVALIDLGLQIDAGQGVGFSGLMVSASLLWLLGLISAFAGWLIARDPKAPPAPEPAPRPRDELRETLEELALMFLKDFKESQERARARERAPADEPR